MSFGSTTSSSSRCRVRGCARGGRRIRRRSRRGHQEQFEQIIAEPERAGDRTAAVATFLADRDTPAKSDGEAALGRYLAAKAAGKSCPPDNHQPNLTQLL